MECSTRGDSVAADPDEKKLWTASESIKRIAEAAAAVSDTIVSAKSTGCWTECDANSALQFVGLNLHHTDIAGELHSCSVQIICDV